MLQLNDTLSNKLVSNKSISVTDIGTYNTYKNSTNNAKIFLLHRDMWCYSK